MNETTQLDILDVSVKVPLSVQLIALYLRNGKRQADIARICNVTPQAVNDYINNHSDELSPLTVRNDDLMAITAQHVASKSMNKLVEWLDDPSCKKMPAVLNAVSGTHIDKYRLLSGQSTENLSIAVIDLSEVK